MSHDPFDNSGAGGRVPFDPARLREISRWSVVASVVMHFMSSAGWLPLSDAIYTLTWVVLPFIGISLGLGTAHVLRHGIGRWRAVAQLAIGTVLVQAGFTFNAIVEIHTDRVAGQAVSGLVQLVIYVGALISVAAVVGLIIGIVWPGLLKRVRDFERSDV